MSRDNSPTTAPLWVDTPLEALMARAEKKYTVCFEPVSAGGVTLEILQIANMREILDEIIRTGALQNALTTLPLWAKIWPASLILGHCLRHLPREHSVLEIGAGCGVSGLIAAALGFSRVCISDINEDALLFARITALKNNLPHVEVRRVDISSDRLDDRFSLILGAEILYLEPLYRPLAKFLHRHLAPSKDADSDALNGPRPEIILASDHRRNPKLFFKAAEKYFSAAHKQVGARATDADSTERHLLTLHTLSRIKALYPSRADSSKFSNNP